MIGTLTQGHLLPMVAPAAILRRIGRIDFDEGSPSFFRFGGQSIKELRPCCVTDAFGKTMMVNHAVDVQVLHTDHSETINDLSRRLMGEIVSSEGNPLMNSGDDFAMLATFGCAFCQFGVLTLDRRQRLLFRAEELRVGNLFTGRKRGKGLETHIHADLGVKSGQAERLTLHREAHVPFPGTASVNGTGLDAALDWAVVNHLHRANLGQGHASVLCEREATLGEGEAIVAITSTEAREAWRLAGFPPTEERLKGEVYAHGDILKDLGMHGIQRGAFLFQDGIGGLLPIAGQTLTTLLVGCLAVFKQVVIQPATLIKGFAELTRLFLGGIKSILKHLTHIQSINLNCSIVKGGDTHPIMPNKASSFIPCHVYRG